MSETPITDLLWEQLAERKADGIADAVLLALVKERFAMQERELAALRQRLAAIEGAQLPDEPQTFYMVRDEHLGDGEDEVHVVAVRKYAYDALRLFALASEARVKESAKDAERYRWLRDVAPEGIGDMASVRASHTPVEIDAAIDAALSAAWSGEGE